MTNAVLHKSRSRTIGRLLREARAAAGLSQEELAFRAEIDRTYPSRLELGLRQPTIDVFLRLCRGMQVEPHLLMRKIAAALD
jgi:transcriptional regulator with XRE-family HTH domain